MIEVDLKPLHAAIRNRGLMELWADGLFVESESLRRKRAEDKAEKAEQTYIRMMESPKNDDSIPYQQWALQRALGVDAKKAGYGTKATRRGRHRGLG